MSVIDVTSIRRTINHDGDDDPCLAGQKAPNHRRLCGKVAELNYKRAVVVIRQSNFSTRILSLSPFPTNGEARRYTAKLQ